MSALIEHRLVAQAPIAHGNLDVDTGNVSLFRRIPRIVDGHVVGIPAISAGALRGVVRRILWREIFHACGLSRETFPGGDKQWDRLYAALANGGTIESAETRVSPDTIRARRAALPPLSLLGAALYSSHMAGLARVSNSWLECSELGTGEHSMYALLAEEHRVRHVDREEADVEQSGVKPMPTTTETVVTGAAFSGHTMITAELEASCWAHGLDQVSHIGGKAGQGYGAVSVEHNGDGALYRAWLAEHVEDLTEALVTLGEELAGGGKKKKAS